MIMHSLRKLHHVVEHAMRNVLTCCLLVCATGLSAQQVHCLTVEGQGAGGALGPVKGAVVRWPGGASSTNVFGQCTVTWDGIHTVHVQVMHVSFDTLEVDLGKRSATTDGCWNVVVQEHIYTTREVVVTRPAPEPVFLRPDLHAADLLINDAGVWVLAYAHPRMLKAENESHQEILRDVRLVLLDTLFRELASCPVPEDVLGLRRDLRDEVVLEGTAHAFGVLRNGDDLRLVPFGLDDLRKKVLPWTDSIPGRVLGSNNDQVLPAFDHIAYDPVNDSAALVVSVVDSFMMRLFRSEYRFLKGPEKVAAMNLAAELHVDKEIVAGYMSGFQHNIWFKPVYAPLFTVGDTLLVLDHANGLLRKFDHGLTERGRVPLRYLTKGAKEPWAGRVVQDRRTRTLYAVFQRNGTCWLRAIDPVSGALAAKETVTYTYPERLQVHNGYLYYVYRPFESLQKKGIYRERLR